MADPLSVTASALHGVKLVLKDLKKIQDAPETIQRLTEDVQTVQAALQLLRALKDEDLESLDDNVAECSKTILTVVGKHATFSEPDWKSGLVSQRMES
jgi:hypothetical protein